MYEFSVHEAGFGGYSPKGEAKFEVPEIKVKFGESLFQDRSCDSGNVRDRRGMVDVSMAFVTSGSMMRSPPPRPSVVGARRLDRSETTRF